MAMLSVNIDHVATIRQARYPDRTKGCEPDPVRAAHEAELGGALGITVHLREDRRHIHDDDVRRLRDFVHARFNLEMAATDEMTEIARHVRPDTVMLVPEGRMEVTTEGGLDVAGQTRRLAEVVGNLKDADLLVSAFIDPDLDQVRAASEAGFDICEVHTGPYAHAFIDAGGDFRRGSLQDALDDVERAGEAIVEAGMRFNAGHALNYLNVRPIADLDDIEELHIGHAIIARAAWVGVRDAVTEMVGLIE